MGRFVIVDEHDIAGGGVILEDAYPRRTHDSHARGGTFIGTRAKSPLDNVKPAMAIPVV